MARSLVIISLALVGEAAAAGGGATSCGTVKAKYKGAGCCGNPTKEVGFQIVPDPKKSLPLTDNPCEYKKPADGGPFDNFDCFKEGVVQAGDQAGGDVTEGFKGDMAVNETPITKEYWQMGLCPVNVHWHLGAEHRSEGQYDEEGKGPLKAGNPANESRRLANVRYGFACHHYDENDVKFTEPYHWQHCVDMHVGETYEVHWPHSAIGACHTPHQYQSPFYDGVFCGWNDDVAKAVGQNEQNLVDAVGVQSQIFTIVNDDSYYYPDLMRGAVVDGDMWKYVTAYTGSTTGTSRNNEICSAYTPITWQVDRTCHLISASTFDKMCADMKQQADDMSMDLHAHGARELVHSELNANNQRPAGTR